MDKVSVVERSELTVAKKSQRTYFTVVDDTGRKMVCFDTSLYNKCEVGNVILPETQPGRTETDDPRLVGIAGSEATPPPEPPKTGHTPRGEEVGRAWNAIDALYIGGKLNVLFGKENAEAILKYYRGVLTSTLKLPVDGAKLPMWDKKTE